MKKLVQQNILYFQGFSATLFLHSRTISGKLMEHLQEIDSTCQERLEQLTCQIPALEGVTEALKAENQMEWVQRMNAIHHQVEELLLAELIFT